MSCKFFTRSCSFIFVKRQKSHGLKSGEKVGWCINLIRSPSKLMHKKIIKTTTLLHLFAKMFFSIWNCLTICKSNDCIKTEFHKEKHVWQENVAVMKWIISLRGRLHFDGSSSSIASQFHWPVRRCLSNFFSIEQYGSASVKKNCYTHRHVIFIKPIELLPIQCAKCRLVSVGIEDVQQLTNNFNLFSSDFTSCSSSIFKVISSSIQFSIGIVVKGQQSANIFCKGSSCKHRF